MPASKYKGGQTLQRKELAESLNLQTQAAWSLSQGGPPETPGPTNVINL